MTSSEFDECNNLINFLRGKFDDNLIEEGPQEIRIFLSSTFDGRLDVNSG